LLTLTIPKRFFLAILGGALAFFAYPSANFWPAIFASVLLLVLAVRKLGFWKGFLIGFVGGFSYFVAQIYWISQYLGPVPLIALAACQALFFALASGIIAALTKTDVSPLLLSIFIATVWTGREWVSTHYPYGGFPWSRVSMSQADSPLAQWVSIGGFGFLSFIVVFLTIYAFELLLQNRTKTNFMLLAGVWCVAFVVPSILSLNPISATGHLRVAGVQGNANAGLFANEDRGTILKNHADVTESLLSSGERFDLVVWPENASDLNPDDFPEVSGYFKQLVDDRLKKPLIIGTITHTEDYSQIFNSSKLYEPGRGEVDQYDKKRPVPFGEYVPDRDFFYALSPDLVGMITRGYNFGTRDPIFETAGTKVGVLICFEEAIDELPRDAVKLGASILVAQTNNADFGKSDESVQQLAIARLRAIETGRSLINISTVGPSALIDPHGRVIASTNAYKPEFVVGDLPLSEQKTLAMLGGWMFDPATAIASGGLWIWIWLRSRSMSTKL
jgi:apolipoprotein N-acyltransferase